MDQKIGMTLIKSTKGTHVYGSDTENVPITTVYVRRTALPTPPPEGITITITKHDKAQA